MNISNLRCKAKVKKSECSARPLHSEPVSLGPSSRDQTLTLQASLFIGYMYTLTYM